ncbi:MAG: MotA/TolQ/ExbB proton channel family protein [Gammaproteobacteria bacterium]
MNRTSNHLRAMLIYAAIGVLFVAALHHLLPAGADGRENAIAALLIDREFRLYPLSLQNIMWVFFFIGMGGLWQRFRQSAMERAEYAAKLLPEDDETVLTHEQLPAIYRAANHRSPLLFLPRLLRRIILQFNVSQSIDSANALLNSSMELFMHELELRYNFLRYIMWLIPTLGFIGTVVGISDALAFAGIADTGSDSFLPMLTQKLAVAFNTTLLALLQAAVLVFLLHVVQGEEENALNHSAQYCLDNLINRLYEEKVK